MQYALNAFFAIVFGASSDRGRSVSLAAFNAALVVDRRCGVNRRSAYMRAGSLSEHRLTSPPSCALPWAASSGGAHPGQPPVFHAENGLHPRRRHLVARRGLLDPVTPPSPRHERVPAWWGWRVAIIIRGRRYRRRPGTGCRGPSFTRPESPVPCPVPLAVIPLVVCDRELAPDPHGQDPRPQLNGGLRARDPDLARPSVGETRSGADMRSGADGRR